MSDKEREEVRKGTLKILIDLPTLIADNVGCEYCKTYKLECGDCKLNVSEGIRLLFIDTLVTYKRIAN